MLYGFAHEKLKGIAAEAAPTGEREE